MGAEGRGHTGAAEPRIARADFHGDPNIGLFSFATDAYVLAPDPHFKTDVLRVPRIETKAARTNLCGIFFAGNSNGILVPWIIHERELDSLKAAAKKLNLNVTKLESKHTALGNLILCNDRGAIVSPLLRQHLKEIKDCLGVRVVEGKIMDLDIVGSLATATNRGFLLNMHASASDLRFVKKVLSVDGDIGTVNFGSGFVKSGLVVNSRGLLIGNQSTGPEIMRITEALKFV